MAWRLGLGLGPTWLELGLGLGLGMLRLGMGRLGLGLRFRRRMGWLGRLESLLGLAALLLQPLALLLRSGAFGGLPVSRLELRLRVPRHL